MCFFLNLFAPLLETFADAGNGDGGGPFRTILIHFVYRKSKHTENDIRLHKKHSKHQYIPQNAPKT